MSDVTSAAQSLNTAWTATQQQWAETSGQWRDVKEAGFERQYWSVLERDVSSYLDALSELIEEIRQSQQTIAD